MPSRALTEAEFRDLMARNPVPLAWLVESMILWGMDPQGAGAEFLYDNPDILHGLLSSAYGITEDQAASLSPGFKNENAPGILLATLTGIGQEGLVRIIAHTAWPLLSSRGSIQQ